MDEQAIKKLFHEVLDERDRIDAETHREDHEWIHVKREREMRRQKIITRARDSAIGTIITALIMGMIGGLAWIGRMVWEGVHRNPPH